MSWKIKYVKGGLQKIKKGIRRNNRKKFQSQKINKNHINVIKIKNQYITLHIAL